LQRKTRLGSAQKQKLQKDHVNKLSRLPIKKDLKLIKLRKNKEKLKQKN
jgi:hypothetical protein